MQPVEDIWTCNRCGWTYPNHHPSAKHRRNHKKVCGKVPGHIIDDHHGHGNGGSSDEASSGDEASYHHHKVSSPAPSATPVPVPAVESQPRSFDLSAALQKPDASSLEVSKATELEPPKAAHATEPAKSEVTQKPVVGSAVPHPEEDLWICRACGWTYPNAHPSAKHRRNHKKHCAGKVGPVEHAPGGSSDDDSDGGHHGRKEIAVKANVAESAPDPEAQKAETAATPVLSSTREFSLESLAPKETVPEAAADAPKKVEAAPAVLPIEPASAATTTPSPTAPPVVAPKAAGSAVPHPDDDIWICKECGWTYPNHHPSAKHRRNHKKQCPGKVAAAAPAPGGSSDDDSDDEHHHHSKVHGTKPEVVDAKLEAPHTNSVSREFDLESLPNKQEAAAEDGKKPESGLTLLRVAQSPEAQAPAEVESEKAAVPEATEKEITLESPPLGVQKDETPAALPAGQDAVADAKASAAPKVGSAVPHPDDDIWICRLCGWTYPNHHPSAKHRRNHKKQCGKIAAAAPAHAGSSDDDSGDEHHDRTPAVAAKPEVEKLTSEAPSSVSVSRDFSPDLLAKSPAIPEIKQPDNFEPQVAEEVEVHAPNQEGIPPAPAVVSNGVAREEVDPPPAESKETSESILPPTPSVAAPKENVKVGLLHAFPPVGPSDSTGEKQPEGTLSAVPKSGSAVPHPDHDIWICKECGWTYPNHHPSAKHRRNHKKHCPGKVAAAAPAPGGSSDEDSDDEHHHQTLVAAPKPEVSNVANDGPPEVLVSREFNVELPAKEAQAAEVKVHQPESSSVLPPGVEAPEAQAPADAATPAIVSEGTAMEEKPVEPAATFAPEVDNVAVAQEILKEETPVATTPAVVPKEVSKKDLKVTKPSAASASLSSAVPHSGDVWKCGHCDWTYPNHHPSAKHRRNHKKQCPGEAAAAAKGGSSDDDSDNETRSHAPAKENTPLLASAPTEAGASVPREFTFPASEVKEAATSAAPHSPKLEEPEQELPPAPPAIPQEKGVAAVGKSSPVVSTAAPKAAGSAEPHPEDPNDIWICKVCGWTYPNAHPSAKHRRNHKKQCQPKSAAIGHAPAGSSDDDSDDGGSHRGRTFAAGTEVAPAPELTVKERGLGVQPTITNTPAEVEVPKTETPARASLAQLVSEEQIREQEGKSKEEVKANPHGGRVCKECGWTYPNPHPSAKHRRNHKKVCKKTNSAATRGGSSSDASSDDDHIGHFGKKKCFPCL